MTLRWLVLLKENNLTPKSIRCTLRTDQDQLLPLDLGGVLRSEVCHLDHREVEEDTLLEGDSHLTALPRAREGLPTRRCDHVGRSLPRRTRFVCELSPICIADRAIGAGVLRTRSCEKVRLHSSV